MHSEALILTTDAQGMIIPVADKAVLQDAWQPPLAHVIDAYRARFGPHLSGVYLRGSVAAGKARLGISDIDSFALVTKGAHVLNKEWRARINTEVAARWPFVQGVELLALDLDQSISPGPMASIIKTQSVCLHGTDISPELPPVAPGFDLVIEGWDLLRNVDLAQRCQNDGDPERAEKSRIWAAKKILRSAFELVMPHARCFTRDLVACHDFFVRYYPDHAHHARLALGISLCDQGSSDDFNTLVDFSANWLYPNFCTTYGHRKIEQLMAQSS